LVGISEVSAIVPVLAYKVAVVQEVPSAALRYVPAVLALYNAN